MPESARASANVPAPAASLLDIPIHRRPAPGPIETAPSPEDKAESAPDTRPFVESEQREAPAGNAAAFPPPADLYTYWRRLARVGIPDVDQLDAATISANWPYALLLRGRVRAPMDIVRVFRPAAMAGDSGPDGGSHPLAGDLCSQVSSWALTLARDAMMQCEPVVAVERFLLSGQTRRYRGLALPCHRAGSTSAYVLLYLHMFADSE